MFLSSVRSVQKHDCYDKGLFQVHHYINDWLAGEIGDRQEGAEEATLMVTMSGNVQARAY